MIRNIILQEAVEEHTSKVGDAVKEIKRELNVVKLARYRSFDSNSKLYTSFFLNTLPDNPQFTSEEWGQIYSQLLSNDVFCSDFGLFLVMWRPAITTGMFSPLWAQVQSELSMMKENKVRFLSLTKATFSMIQMKMSGIFNLIKAQIHDVDVIAYLTVIDQSLNQFISNINAMTRAELDRAVKPDDVTFVNTPYSPIPEATEIIEAFANCDSYIEDKVQYYMKKQEHEALQENIIRNSAEKIKEMHIAHKKASRDFDEFVTRKINRMREERRNRKHSEMVNEALRISREIKRLLGVGGLAILNPAAGAIAFIVSVCIDRATDKKDRDALIGQIRDELEIVEEKINMAERNGDDKARIELIRFRQKLQKEYERINKVRYSPQLQYQLNQRNR